MLQAFVYGSTNARLMDYDAIAGVNKLFAANGGTVLPEYTELQAAVPMWTKSYTYLGDTQLATITPGGTDDNVEFNHPDRLEHASLQISRRAGTRSRRIFRSAPPSTLSRRSQTTTNVSRHMIEVL